MQQLVKQQKQLLQQKKDDVTTEAVKRNDISASTKKEEKKPKAEMAYSADGVDVESQKRMVALGEEKTKEKTVAIANAPDSKKPNSFGSIADQRAAAAEKDKDKPAFSMPTPTAIVGETKKPNMFGSVAEQREKASAKEKDKPTVQKQNTRKPWSLEGGGPAGGGSNLGPYGPKTPMYDQDKDTSYPDSSKKQSLGSRLLSRMGSFGGRKSPTAGPATPSTPTSTATPTTSTTSTTPTTPAPSAVANEPVMFDQSQFKGASGNIKVGGSMGTGGSSVGNKVDSSTYQNISGGGGPVTATTSGKARSNAKGGVVASTSGSATASHPRAQNAGRGSRPTNKGK